MSGTDLSSWNVLTRELAHSWREGEAKEYNLDHIASKSWSQGVNIGTDSWGEAHVSQHYAMLSWVCLVLKKNQLLNWKEAYDPPPLKIPVFLKMIPLIRLVLHACDFIKGFNMLEYHFIC